MLAARSAPSPRGLATREITDASVRITDPHEVHVLRTARKPSPKIAATEALHLIAGVSSLEQLDMASNGKFSQFADNGRLRGAYGPRAAHQLQHVIRLLSRDPDTRQAVVTVWTGGETSGASRDVPCTLGYQFLIRDQKLHLRVSMRSNDIWLGTPYDWEIASALQRTVALALGIPPGGYTHTVASLHMYERDAESVAKIVSDGLSAGIARMAVPPLLAPSVMTEPAVHDAVPPAELWQHACADALELCFHSPYSSHYVTVAPWLEFFRCHVPPLGREYRLCQRCRYIAPHDPVHCRCKLWLSTRVTSAAGTAS